MKRPKRIPGRAEKRTGYLILGLLVIIAAGHFMARRCLDPDFQIIDAHFMPGSISAPLEATAEDDLAAHAPASVRPMTAQEAFTADTLYEKIDGKAEVYLPAGFRKLTARRFAHGDGTDDWFEVFVYQMKEPAGAFSVYSLQRREDFGETGFNALHGYRSGQSLFFVHGANYIEIIAASDAPELQAAMNIWAERYIAGKIVEASAGAEGPELFPSAGLDPDSVTLLLTDAFGFDRLDRVFTAEYREDGAEVMAFLSRREDPEEATTLAAAYRRFLLTHGGEEEPGPDIEDARMIRFYDTYTIVFTRGPYLAGVHMAEDRRAALGMAEDLSTRLTRRLDEAAE